MTHKGCGGEIVEDSTTTYEHEGTTYFAYRCNKCGEEILGDAQIDLPEEWEL